MKNPETVVKLSISVWFANSDTRSQNQGIVLSLLNVNRRYTWLTIKGKGKKQALENWEKQ